MILTFDNLSVRADDIAVYRFKSDFASHPIGEKIILATLLSWATIDLCFADELIIDAPLDLCVKEYVEDHFALVTSTYANIYQKPLATLIFTNVIPSIHSPIELNSNAYFLANTGGRDSTLCRFILEAAGKEISYYKVSYDHANPLPYGHIDLGILNEEIYESISISGIKRSSLLISTHQADDIHVTFAAPYFSLMPNLPATLAVGLPWESIHVFSNGSPDLVPTESYASIQLLIKLFRDFGLLSFNIISPLATLHSLGVYNLLIDIMGEQQMLKLDSCWNSDLFNGEACETCPKCQRIHFILSKILSKPQKNALQIKSADFLFGSLHGYQLLEEFPHTAWHKTCILDETSLAFSGGFEKILIHKYHVPVTHLDNWFPKVTKDEQSWDELLDQIASLVEMDYRKFSDKKIHNRKVPYLPFEKDYKWGRKNQILSCYQTLDLPDLPIFKKWLN